MAAVITPSQYRERTIESQDRITADLMQIKMYQLLLTFSWQELRHHPWRHAAAVLAVMLGVALAFSVHLINASALDEFSHAVRAVGGQPDLELRATQGSFDETLYGRLARHPQVAVASPVLEFSSQAVSANGQGCVNGTRLLVQRSIYDQYLQMLQAMAGHIKIGDPLDPTTLLGPVISEQSAQRILGMVQQGVAEGGRLVCGGERLGGDFTNGYFLPITLVADVAAGSSLAQHEVFGPVLAITPFDTEEEAIALANGTDYGLGGYIHTQNLRRAHHVASQLDAGQIQVNASGEAMTPCVPFGGMKQSGYGRLGGEAGLHEFLRIKNVLVSLAKLEG